MLSVNQKRIIDLIRNRGGEITKADAVFMLEPNYYCNAEKHVGDILSRMVDTGLLVRVKAGVFKVNDEGTTKGAENADNQLNLF